jgi:hypothetical protein
LSEAISSTAQTRKGFAGIVLATVAAGIAGYLITWLVFRFAGSSDYAQFAVFWSAFFLLAGGFAGVQHETARATSQRPTESPAVAHRTNVAMFAGLLASAVVIVVVVTAPLWMPALFQGDWVFWAVPFAAGTAATIVMSATAGSLYGIGSWRLIAVMVSIDAGLRLAAVGIVLAVDAPVELYGWAIIAPIPLTLISVLPWLVRALRKNSVVDSTFRKLTWNVARTIAASMATGVLVSGFPAILAATTTDVGGARLGDVIFAVTLARAPLIVTVMALQSFLVVQFRDRPQKRRGLLLRIGLVLIAATLVAAGAAFVAGAPVFDFVSGRTVGVDGAFLVVLVASSGLVAMLQATGAYLVAESRHGAYSLGLIAAAVATFGLVLIDRDFDDRVSLSLLVAPALGLAVHLATIIFRKSDPRARG